MFGLFKKRRKASNKRDKVYASVEEKNYGMMQSISAALDRGEQICLFYFFRDTSDKLETQLNGAGIAALPLETADRSTPIVLINANETAQSIRMQNQLTKRLERNEQILIFAEHHPLASHEQRFLELLSTMTPKKATFFISLREPLMSVFGSERLIEIMDRMGYKENDCIEHDMITKSITRAQAKIEKHIGSYEIRADSQEEWFEQMNQISQD